MKITKHIKSNKYIYMFIFLIIITLFYMCNFDTFYNNFFQLNMEIILFNEVCLFDENKTIIYGQYDNDNRNFSIEINPKLQLDIVFCKDRNDFYIEIPGKITHIDKITYRYNFIYKKNIEVVKKDIDLSFPFENCNLNLNADSAIISTMCKDYSSRLDEWIQYNLNLGFSGIIIFDNDENNNNVLKEPQKNIQNNRTTSDICKNYNGKVWCVKFSYKPFKGIHWNSIQRISLHIGVNAFRNKCGKIALIDPDEFIHIPNKSNINDFLLDYKGQTLTMQSNILTNKSDDDVINNNILDLCFYIGKNLHTKTIIDTTKLKHLEFITTPHNHPTQILLNKDTIIHYHCWVNSRYKYKENMSKIKLLKYK